MPLLALPSIHEYRASLKNAADCLGSAWADVDVLQSPVINLQDEGVLDRRIAAFDDLRHLAVPTLP